MGPAADRHLLGRLGAALRSISFTEDGVAAALRMSPGTPIGAVDRAVHTRRLTGSDALSAVVRLVVLGARLRVDEVASALAPVTPDDLVDSGLVERDGGMVRGTVRITPYDGLLLAHDADDAGPIERGHVGGVSPAARTLACLTLRTPARRALDVGTGCGVQALLAARHVSQVVAVDVNPRALWLTEVNAGLNGVSNVECRLGSLYEPVLGEQFDLIVANPPFVLSPDSEYTFRDSGMEDDAMSRAVVVGAAATLTPGGSAHVLCNWVQGDGSSDPPVPIWVDGSGCDVLLLHYETVDPLTYASRWALPASGSTDDAETRLDRWLGYYRTAGITAIGLGAVVLRRSPARSCWARTFEMTSAPSGPAGDQLGRMMQAADDAAVVGDEAAVLTSVFELVDGHHLGQSLHYRDGRYGVAASTLTFDNGVGLTGDLDPVALHVFLRIDGRRTLAELIDEAAEETGLDRDELAAAALAATRRLFAQGYLIRS